jgi:hypothetical protein
MVRVSLSTRQVTHGMTVMAHVGMAENGRMGMKHMECTG